jgi:drug/metabolite transporter (DMT)-like permease
MRLVAAGETVGHADFYSSATAVFTLIFISIAIILLAPKLSEPGPSENPPWWAWICSILLVAFGIAIPLAILAGFIQDASGWRAGIFGADAGEALVAAYLVVFASAEPKSRTNTGSGNGQSGHQGS